jgi:phosphoglycolate phosphatase
MLPLVFHAPRARRARTGIASAMEACSTPFANACPGASAWSTNHRFVVDSIRFEPSRHAAAIVDLDGTMVNTLGDFERALALTLADLGLPPVGRPFIARTVGRGSQYLLAQSLAEVGGAADRLPLAWERYQVHYEGVNGVHAEVYPGVAEGLAALRARGWRLACVTNKPRAFALHLLQTKGLADAFEHVFGGDSFERHKPDPLPLLKTCEALGTTPAQTLVIGDSRNDCEAARAAGCPVVLVDYGFNHGEAVELARPDAVISRIDALAW